MTEGSDSRFRRWAPEWIAVVTLTVTIVALGDVVLASMNAMETRIREDTREMRSNTGTLREQVSNLDARVSSLDGRVLDLDGRVSSLDRRALRLEVRFDEEFPPRRSSTRDGQAAPGKPTAHRRTP